MRWGSLSNPGGMQGSVLFFAFALFFSVAYLVFALPSVSFEPPTLNDSSTTGFTWVFVNVTSSEPLNQSLLEWGNQSGYFNFTMLNSSQTNWFLNVSNLADGAYNYTVWAQNTTGDWNQSQRRFVAVDTIAPNITAWSTNGTNASSITDPLFLVGVGESVLFNVTVVDMTNLTYQWLVNKINQNQNANNFTFSVPACDPIYYPSACIWEIHLIVNDSAGNEAHKEWIVSNLTTSEAPTIFDSFSDGKFRLRSETDPWGRVLSEWFIDESGVNTYGYQDVQNGYLTHNRSTQIGIYGNLIAIPVYASYQYGTWEFQYRYDHAYAGVEDEINPVFLWMMDYWNNSIGYPDALYHRYVWQRRADGHFYFKWDNQSSIPLNSNNPQPELRGDNGDIHMHDNGGEKPLTHTSSVGGSNIPNVDGGWHTITVIRTSQIFTLDHTNVSFWYIYQDNKLWQREIIRDESSPKEIINYVAFATADGVNINYFKTAMDNLRFWNGSYKFPKKNISYVSENSSILLKGGSPANIDSANSIRLQEISDSVNNVSLFVYYPSNKTAYSNTNITILDGGMLYIDNESLLFSPASNGDLAITIDSSSGLWIRNSTINSTNFNAYEIYGGLILDIVNSSINYVSLHNNGQNYLNVENTRITTKNVIGRYTGNKPLFFGHEWSENTDLNNIIVSSVSSGKIYLSGWANVYDSDFGCCTIVNQYGATSNLVNVNISLLEFGSGDDKLYSTYYADMLVSDSNSLPVNNARVTITNELNNTHGWRQVNMTYGEWSTFYAWTSRNRWKQNDRWQDNGDLSGASPTNCWGNLTCDLKDGRNDWATKNNKESFHTATDGHTPLPIGNDATTAVLIDFYKDITAQVNMTYTLSAYDPNNIWTNVTHTIYPNGTIQQLQPLAQVNGVNPDESWYRPDPNVPTYTVNLTINYTKTNLSVNANQNATNIIVTRWDTSLPQGQILVNFTAESVDGNNVNFTVCSLVASTNYEIKNDGSAFATKTADPSGCIWFNNSVWTSHTFTVEEQSQGPSGCSAINAATYNATTNTIVLNNQTSTLCTIYYDVKNASALSYDSSDDTYWLQANISLATDTVLVIEYTHLVFNSTGRIQIYTSGCCARTLSIHNSSITSTEGYGRFSVRGSINITNSVLSNLGRSDNYSGYGGIVYGQAFDSSSYFIVDNNTIKDSYHNFNSVGYGNAGNVLRFTNNNVSNLQRNVLSFYNQNENGLIANNIFINSTRTGAVAETNAVIIPCLNCTTEHNLFDGFGDGVTTSAITAKEKEVVTHRYNTIKNGAAGSTGINMYFTWPYTPGNRGYAYNNTIINVTTGITTDGDSIPGEGGQWVVYNNTILNSSQTGLSIAPGNAAYNSMFYGNFINNSGSYNIYVGSGDMANISVFGNTLGVSGSYSVYLYGASSLTYYDNFQQATGSYWFTFRALGPTTRIVNPNDISIVGYYSDGVFNLYYYFDVNLTDKDGKAVPNAEVRVTNEVNSTYPPIDISTPPQERSVFRTASNGHTSTPSENANNTVLIMDYWETESSRQNMTYSLSVFDPSNIWTNVSHTVYPNGTIQQLQPLAQVSGINPDASWYRPNPNAYQNTTTMQINYTRTNLTVNANQNETNITVAWWNTSLPQGQILVNFTAESIDGNNVNFTVCSLAASASYAVKNDGSAFATTTANSQGCIWFNNSVWTSHVFTVEEQSQGIGITSWYTNGTNASSPTDNMFLVSVGEPLFFNITVNGTVDTYSWLVNKVEQNRNSNNFTFDVPACDPVYDPSLCIWEIHLTVNDSSGNEAHKEWVISNLTLDEAPTIFESFTDGNYQNRVVADPWGRPLQEWNKTLTGAMDLSAENGYARTVNLQVHMTDTSDSAALRVNSTTSNGTWFLRYRWWPNDSYTAEYNSWTGLDLWPIQSTNNTAFVELYNVVDGHWWFLGGPSNVSRNYFSYPYINMVGSQISSALVTGTSWHNITLIRDGDGYLYTYLDGSAVSRSMDRSMDIPDSEFYIVNFLTHSPYPLEVDDIQVYSGRYLPPNPSIYYDPGQNAVIINGHGVGLERIAQAVGNESIFNYTPATATAVSNKDLKIMPGTNFHIRDGMLKMNSTYDGERKIFYGNDVNLIFENATVTSTSSYYFLFSRFGDVFSNIAFQVINSTLNNTGGLDSTAVDSLYFSNCNLTNLVGATPINFYFRVPTHKLLVENCLFQGKTGSQSIVLQGGMQFEQLYPSPGLNIINTRFENATLYRRYDWPYTYSNCRPVGIANLINSNVSSKSFDGTILRNKYYLDVLVKNSTGSPQENAVVSIANNNDNGNYTSENLNFGQSWLLLEDQYDYENCYASDNYQYFWAGPPDNKGQLSNHMPAWMRINPHPTGITGADGHTPLPGNKIGTFVLTGSLEQDGGYTRNFTYNLTAQLLAYSGSRIATVNNQLYPENVVNVVHPNGTIDYLNGAIVQAGSANNIRPNASWYRQNPEEYTNTVEMTLQGTDAYFLNLTVAPDSAPVEVIVDRHNFSVQSGLPIVNFTANTTGGNSVNFTLCGLNPTVYHSIYFDDDYFLTRQSSPAGCVNFTTSFSSRHKFDIEETQPPIMTILTPLNITYGSSWVPLNVSVNENASWCGVSLNGNLNQTLNQSSPRSWSLNLSTPSEGAQSISVHCNNTANYFGSSILSFSTDTLSGCYPPNTGTWLVNRTLYCAGNAVMLFPNLTVGSNGSVLFNQSVLNLGAVYVSNGSNLTLLRSLSEINLTGNLSVNGFLSVDSSNILLNGSINLGKNLSLNNLTLRMNAPATLDGIGYYSINVNAGSFFSADSITITRGNAPSAYWGLLKVYGSMLMNNSRVEYTSGGNTGGIYISDPTNRTKVYNSIFYDDWGNMLTYVAAGSIEFRNITSGELSSYAMTAVGGSAVVYDSRLLSTLSVGYGGRIYVINSSMGNTFHSTGGGEIWRQWYLEVYVNDSLGNPVDQANVTGQNATGQQVFVNITDSSGWTPRKILTEYTQIINSGGGSNYPKTYETPHTINVSQEGFTAASVSLNLSQTSSTTLAITLSSQGPSGCSAINAATYNATTNTIVLNNQTSTLCTIYYDLNNISLMSYNLSTNSYLSTANILIGNINYGSGTNLHINNTNLTLGANVSLELHYRSYNQLWIVNSTITSLNHSDPAYILGLQISGIAGTPAFKVINSTFSYLGRWNNLSNPVDPITVTAADFGNYSSEVTNSRFEYLEGTYRGIYVGGWINNSVLESSFNMGSVPCGNIYSMLLSNLYNVTVNNSRAYYGLAWNQPADISTYVLNSYVNNSRTAQGYKEGSQKETWVSRNLFENQVSPCPATSTALIYDYLTQINPSAPEADYWTHWENNIVRNAHYNTAHLVWFVNGGGNEPYNESGYIKFTIKNSVYYDATYGLRMTNTMYGIIDNLTIYNSTYGLALSGDLHNALIKNSNFTGNTNDIYFNLVENANISGTGDGGIFFNRYEHAPRFYNVKYSSVNGVTNWSYFWPYYYLDVNLTKDNAPQANLAVLVTNLVNSSYPPLNMNETHKIELTSAVTGSDGHTPLPNSISSMAILDFWKTSSAQQNMTYSISVYDQSNIWTNVTHTVYPNGTIQQLQPLAQVTGVNPDSSWYRSDPNTYQNTTTLQINYTRTNLSVNANQNATNITVTKWNTSLPKGQILVNFTAESANGNNVNFTVCSLNASTIYAVKKDSSAFMTKTADSQGCIWFNNSAWTSHTFTVAEQVGSLSSCGNLELGNQTYVLVRNVSSAGTCFNILADNITLDGGGYTVAYATNYWGYAINNSGGYDGVTLKNLGLVQSNSSISNASALYSFGMSNSTLINNFIRMSGIYLNFSSNNLIENNTFAGNLLFSETEGFESGFNGWGVNAGRSGTSNYNVTRTTSLAYEGSYSVNVSMPGADYQTVCLEKNYTVHNYSDSIVVSLNVLKYAPSSTGPGPVAYIGSVQKPSGYNASGGTMIWSGSLGSTGVWDVYSYSKTFSPDTSPERTFWICVGASTWGASRGEMLFDYLGVDAHGISGTGLVINSGNSNIVRRNNLSFFFGDGLELLYSNSTKLNNNNFYSNSGRGIYLLGSNQNDISENYLRRHYSTTAIYLSTSSSNNLTRNTILFSNMGVEAYSSQNITIRDNLIDHTTCFGYCWGAGIVVDGSYHKIINNTIWYPIPSGIYNSGGNYIDIINNSIYYAISNGINLEYRGHHNNIIGNTVYGAGFGGIRVKMNAYNLIANNNVSNSAAGIYLTTYHSTSSEFNVIENNTIANYTTGLSVEYQLSNTIRNNNFTSGGTAISFEGQNDQSPMHYRDQYHTSNYGDFFLPSPWDRVLADFPIAGEEVFWVFDAGRMIKSTPAVANNVVYLVADGVLFAVEETSGKKLWEYNTEEAYPQNLSSGGTLYFHSSPAVVGTSVFFGVNQSMYAIGTNGTFLWKFQTSGLISSSPVYNDSRLYFGSEDGYLYSLSFSGVPTWNASLSEPVLSSPVITSDDKVVVRTMDGTTSAYLLNGSGVWSVHTDAGGWSSPIFVGGTNYVVFGTGINSTTGNASLYALNNSNGNIVWRAEFGSEIMATPATESDYNSISVGLRDGMVYSLNAGGDVTTSFNASGPVIASTVRGAVNTFIVTQDGRVHRRWEFLYMGNNWNYSLPSNVSSSPVLAYGKIFVGSENGKLYVFGTPRNTTISGNRFYGNNISISSFTTPLHISNNLFENNTQDLVYSYGVYNFNNSDRIENNVFGASSGLTLGGHSYAYFLNTSFNRSRSNFTDSFSSLSVGWYLGVRVFNSSGSAFGNVSVLVSDSFGSMVFDGVTGGLGYVFTNLTEFVQNSTGIASYTPHTVTVSKAGYLANSTLLELDSSKEVTLVLSVNSAPSILVWRNNVTRDQVLAFALNETQSVFFNVSVDQSVDYFWFKNGSAVGSNIPNYTYANAQWGLWDITVVVNNSNGSSSKTWILTVRDIPNINSVGESLDPVSVGSPISIEANITDLDGDLSGKYAVIDGSWFMMQPNGPDKYLANYTPSSEKVYYYYVYANDSTGLSANSSQYNFTAQQGPTITNISASPLVGNESTNFLIQANVSDLNGVDRVFARFVQPSVFDLELVNTSKSLFNATFNTSTPGFYVFSVRANDSLGSVFSSSSRNFSVLDTNPPNISSVSISPTLKNESTLISVSANVSDFNVSQVYVNISGPANLSSVLDSVGGGVYANSLGVTPHKPGFYSVRITALDGSSNNATFYTNYSVNDTLPPVLNWVSAVPSIGNIGVLVNVSANVSDNGLLELVLANVSKPDFTSSSLLLSGINPYVSPYSGTNLLGLYTLHVFANDSQGNSFFSSSFLFGAANFSIVDTALPSIGWFNVTPQIVDSSQNVTLSANVTDDSGVNYVIASVTRPDSVVVPVAGFSNLSSVFAHNFSGTIVPGFYSVVLIAADIAGNQSNLTSNFTSFDTLSPQIGQFLISDSSPSVGQAVTFTGMSSDNDVVNRLSGWVNVTRPDNLSLLVQVSEAGYSFIGSPPVSVSVQSEASYTPILAGNHSARMVVRDLANNTINSTLTFEAFDVSGPVLVSVASSAVEGWNISLNFSTDEASNFTFGYDAGAGWVVVSNSSFSMNHSLVLPKFAAGTSLFYYILFSDLAGNPGNYPLVGVENFTVGSLLEFNESVLVLNLTEKQPSIIQLRLSNPSSVSVNVSLNGSLLWISVPSSVYMNPLQSELVNISLVPDDSNKEDWSVNASVSARGSTVADLLLILNVFHAVGDGECDSGESCGSTDCGPCSPGGSPAGGPSSGAVAVSSKSKSILVSHAGLKVVVSLKEEVEGSGLGIKKLTSVPVPQPAGLVYQYFNLTKINFNNSNIQTAKVEFKVDQTWIQDNNIVRVYLARFENGWGPLRTELVNGSYFAYTDKFSYFAVVGEPAIVLISEVPIVVNETQVPVSVTANETAANPEDTSQKNAELVRAAALVDKSGILTIILALLALMLGAYAYSGRAN